jgi:hypothetical protein
MTDSNSSKTEGTPAVSWEQMALTELDEQPRDQADKPVASSFPPKSYPDYEQKGAGAAQLATKRLRRISIAVGVVLVVGAGFFWLRSSDPGEPKRESTRRTAEAQRVSDSLLLQDHEKAISTFIERLNNRVRREGEMILVEEGPPLQTLHAFPRNVSWHIECDSILGLSIAFTGNATQENIDGVDVTLTETPLTLNQCRQLVPSIGDALSALSGR